MSYNEKQPPLLMPISVKTPPTTNNRNREAMKRKTIYLVISDCMFFRTGELVIKFPDVKYQGKDCHWVIGECQESSLDDNGNRIIPNSNTGTAVLKKKTRFIGCL